MLPSLSWRGLCTQTHYTILARVHVAKLQSATHCQCKLFKSTCLELVGALFERMGKTAMQTNGPTVGQREAYVARFQGTTFCARGLRHRFRMDDLGCFRPTREQTDVEHTHVHALARSPATCT
eukprot:969332-Amphidinium_carterae.1